MPSCGPGARRSAAGFTAPASQGKGTHSAHRGLTLLIEVDLYPVEKIDSFFWPFKIIDVSVLHHDMGSDPYNLLYHQCYLSQLLKGELLNVD